jgi:ClpP class serine protease
MLFFNRAPVVPVLRFTGPIGMATPLRPGLSLASVATPIEKAFALSKLPTVAVVINSPGGSPVQSHLIFGRIRQLAEEKKKRVYVFCEDIAASGGYFLALAGDEIYADPSSIVGSIGVISASFGLDRFTRRARTRARSIRSSRSAPRTWHDCRSCRAASTTSSSASSRRGAAASWPGGRTSCSRAPSGRRARLWNWA